ncbi:MAG: hypothetical protein KTR18_12560, partial [Acidiferrobacterales bacterium]|nr:hypothetical protein [Acidiferrobacterales bacterium]
YAASLQSWGTGAEVKPDAALWYRKSINQALDVTVKCSESPPEDIYKQLLVANAISMLGFNIKQQSKIATTVSGNVGWLDFTHGLTFANAVRQQCTKYPATWPQGLLQMACFVGRNAAFTTKEFALAEWQVEDIEESMSSMIESVFAHGIGEHIVSVHFIKTALAVREEAAILQPEEASILVASLNRFLHSPVKRRIPRRVAHQSLQFVGSTEAIES